MTDFSYQLYSSRNHPLDETLQMLSRLGYREVEGYGALFLDLADPAALRAKLDEAGLSMTSGHVGLSAIESDPMGTVETVKALGLQSVFVPAIPKDERPETAEGWSELGQRLAMASKPFRDAGMTFGWHNHDFEFALLDAAELPLDLILSGSEDLAWEIDAAWVVRGGQDPVKWIEKYADRIAAVHVKDIAPAGEAADEDGWADVGHGTMDWPAIMEAVRGTGAKHFVMEHDNPSDHERFARRSMDTVRNW